MSKAGKKQLTTQKTLAWCRKQGGFVAVVEHWNPHVGPFGIRQDLFGFADIIWLRDEETVWVQATSWGNVPDRRRKILKNEVAMWLSSRPHHRVLVVGWKKGDASNPRVEVVKGKDDDLALPA